MRKNLLSRLSLIFIFFAGMQNLNAQCDINNPYDKIISAFHSSIALKSNGTYAVWGQLMDKNGTSDVLSPQDINSTNYPGLTGTVLKASVGGFVKSIKLSEVNANYLNMQSPQLRKLNKSSATAS